MSSVRSDATMVSLLGGGVAVVAPVRATLRQDCDESRRNGGQASDQANARRPGRCWQQERTSPIEGTHGGRSVFRSRSRHRLQSWDRFAEPVGPEPQSRLHVPLTNARCSLRRAGLGEVCIAPTSWGRFPFRASVSGVHPHRGSVQWTRTSRARRDPGSLQRRAPGQLKRT